MTASDPSTVGYTPAEAAELCGVSIDTIRRHRKAGRFPRCLRVGEHANAAWRIPLEDLVDAGLFSPAAPVDTPVAHPAPTASAESASRPPTSNPTVQNRLVEAETQVRWLRSQNERLLDLVDRLAANPSNTPETEIPARSVA